MCEHDCKNCPNCSRFNKNTLMGEGEPIPRPPRSSTDTIPAIIEPTGLDCEQQDSQQLELWGKHVK